ncbi:methylenetetrahydrofolate--tRNA-(uracil(54)-C(5))-methyltransferase (FADH(2)-oxidizing) TrmFO [Pseudochelatococcus sp. B33]
MTNPVHIIGGGLAGSEAAWQVVAAGIPVVLHEMRPGNSSPAHKTRALAELVCSNSFRSDDAETNAVGLLHQEMRALGSLIMASADTHQVPAGGALAVDRDGFAQSVTEALEAHPLVTVMREEVTGLPPAEWGQTIIATGPLTSDALARAVHEVTGEGALAFFDAIAPIVHAESIDRGIVWAQSRYDKAGPGGTGADYLNCPMTEAQYNAFVDALLAGEKTEFRDFEKDTPYFNACLPIEIMAERGRETLRFGPMKPVGLTNPNNPQVKPHAIVQLRQDNAAGTLYNIVGFQTKLKYGEQIRILRMIPGLENAEFARLGGLHRNTFINAPKLLDRTLRLKALPRLRFAGQITGCEGYVESAAVGLLAGRYAAAEARGVALPPPPPTTAIGALVEYITGGHVSADEEDGEATEKPSPFQPEATAKPSSFQPEATAKPSSFQPMNVNFGLFPPLTEALRSEDGKRLRGSAKAAARKKALTDRARRDLAVWLRALSVPGAVSEIAPAV